MEELAATIDPKTIQTKSFATRAASYYVQGLKSFFQEHFPEAKRYLRETLKMANAEDLNRLTSCSLVLLGHLFMSSGKPRPLWIVKRERGVAVKIAESRW